jgi:hypothetical protein
MNLLKRIVSYSPYLLILFVVLPFFAEAADNVFEVGIKNVLWTFVNNIFGFLIGAAGVLLDYAVNEYIIGFGETWGIGGSGVGGAIDNSWTIVRDVFNITFIFGLVWLGFKMILRSDDSTTRRTLITLILAALLVNFSLFITKFVVDFTNILATEIAQSFTVTPEGGEANPIGDASRGDAQVSSAFMQLFGLSDIWEGATDETDVGDVSYMYIFGTAIVFLIGAFTFAAGGIMIIIRFAALCIYMVFSPLMFLGMVFPGLQSVSRKYWSGFLGRAFYAPAYLMLIYLAAFVMGSYNSTASGFRNALKGTSPGDTANTIGPFLLTCVFLIASVVVAGKMSADGASTAINMGKNLSGRAQRGLKNTAMFAPRRVARAGAGASANVARRMDNRLLSSDTKFAKAGRTSLGMVGLDARTRNNMIEAGRNAKMGTKYSTADNEKNRLEQQKRLNDAQNERKRTEDYGNNLTQAISSNDPKIRKDAGSKIAGAIGKMSIDEIAKLNLVQLKDKAVASKISDTQLKSMADSGYFSNSDMDEIKTARDEGTFSEAIAVFEDANASIDDLNDALNELGTTVRGLSNERLQSMNVDKHLATEKVATNLTHSQLEALQSSGKFSTGQIEQIKKARVDGFKNIAANGTVFDVSKIKVSNENESEFAEKFVEKQRAKLFSQGAQEAGKLPTEVFADKHMAKHINPAALAQRIRNGLDRENKEAIEKNIQTYVALSTEESKRAQDIWARWASNKNNTDAYGWNLDVKKGNT